MPQPTSRPRLILHEDEHLLVINKPPGINTHAVNIDASPGIYDWLRHRESRWATLSTHQRLDKETSGVLLFGKTREANQWLARRFELREVRKTYQLLTNRDPGQLPRRMRSQIYKAGGNDFRTIDDHEDGRDADTEFQFVAKAGEHWLIEAIPHTGRTHQIRLHARDAGFPILGDEKYGGSPFTRLCLHAHILEFVHPITRDPIRFEAPVDFHADPHIQLRQMLWPEIEDSPTNAWRLIHGASNGHDGWYVDRLGDYLLSQSDQPATTEQRAQLETWTRQLGLKGAYHKQLDRQVRKSSPGDASPALLVGSAAPPRFEILENGIRYGLSFEEGYSVGIFLDQKDNRRRLLTGHVGKDFTVGQVSNLSPASVSERADQKPAAPDNSTAPRSNETTVHDSIASDQGINAPRVRTDRPVEGTAATSPLSGTDARLAATSTVAEPSAPSGAFAPDKTGSENLSYLAGLSCLNAFAYTCAFSVCAAKAGANVTSLDLSRKYLDWGRDNFRLNDLDPDQHDFIFGDCFDWLKRLAKKGRQFDVVLLDPPTFSQSKQSGVFRADKDYGKLVALALPLVAAGGVLFCSTNCATLRPELFLETVRAATARQGRRISNEFFISQPPDFPTSRGEQGYLKTVWLRVE